MSSVNGFSLQRRELHATITAAATIRAGQSHSDFGHERPNQADGRTTGGVQGAPNQ
jgi:hypothetical protein